MPARVVEKEVRVFKRDLPPTDVVQKIFDALAQEEPIFNQGSTHPGVFLNRLDRHLLTHGESVEAEFFVDEMSIDDVHSLEGRVVWRGEMRFRIFDASFSVKPSLHRGGVPTVSVAIVMVSP
jgi:hypothetical protein